MNDQPWIWDDEEVRAAAARARRRVAYVRVAAALVVLYVLLQGIAVYHDLPERLPLDASGPSPTGMRPDSYMPKNPITAFAGLLFGVAFAVVAAKAGAKNDYSRWPGWEKTQLLTAERREHLVLPAREAGQWLGATGAVAMALTQMGMWDLALQRSSLMGYWPFIVGVIVGLAEGITGSVLANRRRKAVFP